MLQERMLKPLEFEFRGKAGEYFRIWIVNVFLTIFTLGVYSAWAKVRTKQYFYGNTILDGSPFEYSASPVAILKGRAVVAIILIIYVVVTHFYPGSSGLFYLFFFLLLPWLVMRSMMFNARYSNYRNLNFSFNKNLADAVIAFILLAILIPLTLGLVYPFYAYSVKKYIVNNHNYGQLVFRLKNIIKQFYKIYLLAGLIFFLGIAAFVIIFKDNFVALAALTSKGDTAPELPSNFMASLYTLIAAYGLIYFFTYAFIQAKTFNAVWSNTSLTKITGTAITASSVPLVAFNAVLSTWKIFYIYVTNTLAILFSAGLLIPWAKIRMAKYKIDHLAVSSITDLQVITAVEKDKEGAIGSEMGDILDIDIGL
jgi:uncharacterized membrane protein YjgN (DUF898 family)